MSRILHPECVYVSKHPCIQRKVSAGLRVIRDRPAANDAAYAGRRSASLALLRTVLI